MNYDSDILDDIFDKKDDFFLFSKLSIILISLLLSPYFGAVIYCYNLFASKQSNRIFGTYFTISICYFLVVVGFLGFNLSIETVNLTYLIPKVGVTLLMIGPIWRKHFEGFSYSSKFPWVLTIMMIVIYFMNIYYNYLLNTDFSYYQTPPYYLVQFNILTITPLILLISTGKIIYNLVLTIYKQHLK